MTVGELKAALAPLADALEVFSQQTATGCDLVILNVTVVASLPGVSSGGITVPSGTVGVT